MEKQLDENFVFFFSIFKLSRYLVTLALSNKGSLYFWTVVWTEPRCIVVGMIYWNSTGQVRDVKAIMCCNNIRMTETYADHIYEIVEYHKGQKFNTYRNCPTFKSTDLKIRFHL